MYINDLSFFFRHSRKKNSWGDAPSDHKGETMTFTVKNNIQWVGKIDWELRKFHGDEYSTHRGSSYNSYLIQEEKTALIDTVWGPFAKEYVENLAQTVDLQKIDYVIACHGENDHSGALPELMRQIPDTPIYCTKNGVKILKGLYHQDWNFHIVKTGDTLDLGNNKTLTFVEAPMLHWPDSMFAYLSSDEVLFSNDAFGQHYASEFMFNDRVDQAELFQECIKYYTNLNFSQGGLKLVCSNAGQLSARQRQRNPVGPAEGGPAVRAIAPMEWVVP